MDVTKSEKGKLPFGIYSKKHNKLNSLIFFLSFIPFLVLAALLGWYSKWYIMLLLILAWSIVLVKSLNSINPLLKANKMIFLDFKVEEGLNLYLDLMKNPLHSQSKLMLQLNYINILIDCDLEKSRMLFDALPFPKTKSVIRIYRRIELRLLISERNEEMFLCKLKEYKAFYPKENKVHNLYENNHKIIFTTEEISNINLLLRIDTKVKYSNVENAATLAVYYKMRNKEEGIRYADFVKEHGKVLTRTYNLLCDYYGKDEREEIK